MNGLDPALETAENYRRFAMHEAAGRSPAYERLAYAVAEDDLVLSFLEDLPAPKRQPNLVFAAARYILGSPPGPASLRSLVTDMPVKLAAVLRARRTQTNEAARCALFLPVLAALPQPLALLEVGAAAGLTLLPDIYSYDYEGHRVTGLDVEAPTLPCRVSGPAPLPRRAPQVVWREGIDLNPLDVNDEDDMAWLSCLVWPDEAGRAERLQAAVKAARRRPPVIHRGDLLDDIAPGRRSLSPWRHARRLPLGGARLCRRGQTTSVRDDRGGPGRGLAFQQSGGGPPRRSNEPISG